MCSTCNCVVNHVNVTTDEGQTHFFSNKFKKEIVRQHKENRITNGGASIHTNFGKAREKLIQIENLQE